MSTLSRADGRLLIGCGAFTGQAVNGSATIAEAHRALLDHAASAEALGLDSFWVAEHHLADDGYLAAVFPLLAAVAARTTRLQLGTRVALAPLYHARRLAEDAAEVAMLSRGRFVLGLGLGYRPEEFDVFGVRLADRASHLREAVALCRQYWSTSVFDPARGPGEPDGPPPIWLGGRANAALKRAATLGDGYVAPMDGNEETAARVAELDSFTSGGAPLPVCTNAFVVIEGSGAEVAARRGLEYVLDQYATWGVPRQSLQPGIVDGTPAQVAASLIERAAAVGERCHDLVVSVAYPGMTPRDVERHLHALATEVAPAVRAAHARH
jgi:alkanesulfonate monooxygenase SsuD/methylene tetrahydromethanopterin reductase-like flavin-dependent oxidoreductase (luciferase family)